MSYTIKELATLSGVSVRTLHFYDEIGLLKPANVRDNGYRSYGKDELLRLQQILFYKEVGFALEEIKKVLEHGDFNLVHALHEHKHALEKTITHKKTLITTIEKTLEHLERNIMMNDKELYYGFDSERQKGYEQYLVEKGIVSLETTKKIREKMSTLSPEAIKKWQNQGNEFLKNFAAAHTKGLKADSTEVQALVKQHYQWILFSWTPTKETYIGLGKFYCEHPEFKVSFSNQFGENFSKFLVEAMEIFADRNLK